MRELKNIVGTIKTFGEGHRMINQVLFIKYDQEIDHLTFKYRTLLMHIDSARIPRDQGEPVYEVDLNLFILDKTIKDDDMAYIESSQENLFILGQLQDFLQQSFPNYDFEINDVDMSPVSTPEYNLTGATTVLTIRVDRNPFQNEVNYGSN